MAAGLQYLTASVSGAVSTPANALGAPDGTFTTDSGNTNWNHTWSFDTFPTPSVIQSDLTITVRHRRDLANGNDPAINFVQVFQSGSQIHQSGNSIPALDGSATDFQFTVPKASLLDLTALSVVIDTTGGGGSPAVRRAIQVDSVTLSYTYELITGTVLKYWTGSAWAAGIVKRHNGSTWEQVALKRWNGSAWVIT